ncbi:protein tyrosine phosphatase [Serratia liquefaciens]|jgi:protein-tyrosine phosphatase|uniref:arsenate reductase/protein-tyrosine-phosphatase family protein n=1 Tax=Serratia liquefaciens TaxID=614 RepID=UPI000D51AC88|nr:protein tyrosine phosphatase [Serratia liquefaciens]PVD45052.1 protein tyrosine phosphatase [Serratia liquefaciens]QHT50271.1 protein tyrosine phosphatase [Serratia liquefaciens]CAI1151310.1 Low molecular weight protein-tyrosine-phosphatase wzb [Serratia liquefaciens]CAI1564018.1 Low molecular weight protein-tyrosine-phosphatase wzb [Serratia liquefaciens]CAI2037439.1 Low molecular weight protein-tyrosine-phosphatase wzb [Serratia liquefaciens]
MFDSILIVCVGNICRSPVGERLLKNLLPNKEISSAGISALVGNSADPKAASVANNYGLSLDGHIARQLTAEMCRKNSLILVMERKHIDAVCQFSPEARGKTMLFGHWNDRKEVVDPYRKSDEVFEFVYHLLAESAQKWVKALN